MLIHGTLMTADDMRLGPMPAPSRAFRCTAFDRPGHGWSDHRCGADASLWSQMEAVCGAVAQAPICFPEPRLEQALFAPRALPVAGDLLSRALGAALDPVMLPAL